MSTYIATLPEVFNCCVRGSRRDLKPLIIELLDRSDLIKAGSSFAYTADGPYLWLSAVSYDYLSEKGYLKDEDVKNNEEQS